MSGGISPTSPNMRGSNSPASPERVENRTTRPRASMNLSAALDSSSSTSSSSTTARGNFGRQISNNTQCPPTPGSRRTKDLFSQLSQDPNMRAVPSASTQCPPTPNNLFSRVLSQDPTMGVVPSASTQCPPTPAPKRTNNLFSRVLSQDPTMRVVPPASTPCPPTPAPKRTNDLFSRVLSQDPTMRVVPPASTQCPPTPASKRTNDRFSRGLPQDSTMTRTVSSASRQIPQTPAPRRTSDLFSRGLPQDLTTVTRERPTASGQTPQTLAPSVTNDLLLELTEDDDLFQALPGDDDLFSQRLFQHPTMVESASSDSWQIPQTPARNSSAFKRGRTDEVSERAAKRLRLIEATPYLRNAKDIAARMSASPFEPFSLHIGDRTIDITKIVKKFNGGGYFDAYLVEGTGLEDDQFVLKVLKSDRFKDPAGARKALRNEFDRYRELKAIFAKEGLSKHLAPHFDMDIAIEQGLGIALEEGTENQGSAVSHGCYLVKYYEDQLDENFKFKRDLSPEGSKEQRTDAQLKTLFQFGYENDLPLDLTSRNCGRDEHGNLVVFDPMIPDGNKRYFLKNSIERHLEFFAVKGSERFRYLDPRPQTPSV